MLSQAKKLNRGAKMCTTYNKKNKKNKTCFHNHHMTFHIIFLAVMKMIIIKNRDTVVSNNVKFEI